MNREVLIAVFISSLFLLSCENSNDQFIDRHNSITNSTIAELKDLYNYEDIYVIEEDIVIEGVVVANDVENNFFRQIVIEDSTGGIVLNVAESPLYTMFPIDTLLRIRCKDLFIGRPNGVTEIGILYLDDYKEKLQGLYGREQMSRCLDLGMPRYFNKLPLIKSVKVVDREYESRLVKLSRVSFETKELGKPFADGETKEGKTVKLIFADSTEIDFRTSGYADFSKKKIPAGKGDITAILGYYSDKAQVSLVKFEDLDF